MGIFTPHFNCTKAKSIALASVAVLTMAAPTMQARTISAEEALQRAIEQPQSKTLNFKVSPRLVYTLPLNSSETPGIYVFGNADNRGFIVVSADDEARALLGYSDNGVFDPENIPAPLAYWLDCYAQEIASLQEESNLKNRVVAQAPDEYIAPLIKTRWTQTAPYNNQCPQFEGRNTVTGCTATAMAQVMKYFNYPEHGTGSNTYIWQINNVREELSSDFAAHTYDWDNMLDNYTGEYTTAQEEAISQLMRDCAISINTAFGPELSTASPLNAFKALVNNFGYDPQARYMERKYYPYAEWEETIYEQLANHGPVFFAGTAPGNQGHAFVLDGYSHGYYHINWGWAGMSDGYYLLSALDPPQQGVGGASSGFNLNQSIITNIYPNEGGDYWIELVSNSSFRIIEKTADVGETINFPISIHNLSIANVKPIIGLAYTNIADNQTTFTQGYNISNELSTLGGASGTIKQAIPSTLTNGTYIVRPAYKDLTGEWHMLHFLMSQTSSYTATVSDNKVTFTENTVTLPEINESTVLTTLYSGSAFKGTITITNPNDSEFYGTIYAIFIENGVLRSIGGEIPVSLEPKETKEFKYTGTCGVLPGNYAIGYYIENPEKQQSYIRITDHQLDVTVAQANIVLPIISNVQFADDNTEDINASELTIIFDAEVVNGIYQGPLYLALYPGNGGNSIHLFPSGPMFFEPGMYPGITLTTDISAWVEIGNSYLVAICAEINKNAIRLTNPYRITIGSLDGITGIMADPADITFSTYYNLNGVQLSGVPSQAGLYIKVDTLSNGTVRSSKVMVK